MKAGRTLVAVLTSLVLTTGSAIQADADEALVAVATNFVGTLETLQRHFEAASGHRLLLSSGSTGHLYTQVRHGAPYDVFLAADRRRPRRLVEEGHAVGGTRRTYAVGRLVLCSAAEDVSEYDLRQRLSEVSLRRLAVANPDLAPYGRAARQTLQTLGFEARLRDRLVMGENVGQAYALVASGNAELGFVALSLLFQDGHDHHGSYWVVPESWHSPIRQDLVLLRRGEANLAARAFLTFLDGDTARAIIVAAGYEVP